MSDIDDLGRRHAEETRASLADSEIPRISSVKSKSVTRHSRSVWTAIALAAVLIAVLLPLALLWEGAPRRDSEPVGGSTAPTDAVTTSTTSASVAVDPPLVSSSTQDALLDVSPLPIRVVEDAVLRVDGSCVTAETGDTATLLVFNLGPPTGLERYVWVQGTEVHFEDIDPATPTLVLSSGARYQFRGIPFAAVDGELAEPMPASCVYDEQLILLGALDAPVGHGLTTRSVEGVEGVGGMGYEGTPTITIDGACTTVSFSGSDRELLVVWPAGTVSLLDDHTIHMSRWEAVFTETVVRSGDNVTLHGSASDRTPDDPPPDCEYDGTYFAEVVRPLEASGLAVDPPLLGSVNEPFNTPIRVVEDAVLRVDGSCVTAETGDTAILLVFDLLVEPPPGGGRYVWVQGAEVHFGDIVPATPTQVLSSGARYQFRGIPLEAVDGELAEPMPSSCVYDEQMILLGALDAPVGHGLTTRSVERVESVPAIGINSTTITIDGACTTVGSGERQLLVIWPAGTVSLLDDHTIHMSRWEALTEVVVRSGDTVALSGFDSDSTPGNPPPDCEYDGTFFANLVRPLGASGRTS